MRQEHKFCAEVYRRLYDLIDHDKRVLFCLDGSAATEAAKSGEVECPTMPDLCFTFTGSDREIRIEAKIIRARRVKLGMGQKDAWCKGGTGSIAPHLWMAGDEGLQRFWMWEHAEFAQVLATRRTSTTEVLVFSAEEATTGSTSEQLVLEIVRWAEGHGFKPIPPVAA